MRAFFLVCLFSIATAFAQPSKIDSLKWALAALKPTPQKVLILSQLGYQYAVNKRLDSCFLFANEALQLAKKIGFKGGETEVLYVKGFGLRANNEYVQSITYFLKALQSSEKLTYYGTEAFTEANLQVKILRELTGLYDGYNVDSSLFYRTKLLSLAQRLKLLRLEAKTTLEVGYSYINGGEYAKALDAYFKSLDLFKQNTTESANMAGPNRAIGYLYVTLGDFQKAKSYLFQAKKNKDANKKGTYYELAHLSNVYEGLNQLDSALYFAKAALQSALTYNLQHELGYIFITYAKAQERLQHYPLALHWYRQGIATCLKQNNLKTLSFAYSDLGKLYRQLGQKDSCIYFAKQAIRYANIVGAPRVIWEASETLAKVYKVQNRLDSAFKYQEKMTIVKDSLLRKEKIQQVQIIGIEHQQREKQSKIAEEQDRKQMMFLSIAGLIALTAILSFIFYRNRTLLQQNAELQAALLEGQTTERKRIAADLHDNLSSMLTAVRWNLMAMNIKNLTDSERKVYEDVMSMATAAHDQVRLISHNLLPEELEKEGLVRALERLIRKLNRSGSVQFMLQTNGVSERLGKKTEFELYSIILELTHNVIKHSGATEAEISLIRQNERIRLVVSDNGKGFTKNRENGMGIQNVESRIKSLNGKWQMHSQAGEGVVFEAEF